LQWQPGPLADVSSESMRAEQRAQLSRPEPDYSRTRGDSGIVLGESADIVSADYYTAYLAHATMEPMNATAHVSADRCELWVPTQAPDVAQNIAAEITGLRRDQVVVHTTYLGGGFGRRVLWDYVVEAVEIARHFDVPVKLVWTREDDMQHGYFRQQTLHRMRGALDENGGIAAWEHTQVATPTGELLTAPTVGALMPEFISPETRRSIGEWLGRKTVEYMAAFQAREGAEKIAYSVPDMSFLQYAWNPGIPVSIWRSVGNAYNAFAVESFVDELAHKAQTDPALFRRKLLADKPRHLSVLDELLRVAGWNDSDSPKGKGLALFEAFGTVVGQIAEVAVNRESADQPIRVHRVVCVVDCGRAINPDIVRAQMQSGIIFGLTAALYGEIIFVAGQVQQSNFHDYRMLRLVDAPEIDVHIIASENEPTGVGEPGTPPIAAAVANAVFALTGERLRDLPLRF
jgi:isoquinoline 1-oxidoreductase/isoquinoline 1-oxidoreductase beta subunit